MALWATPNWIDGNFTTAQPCGLPVFSSPIPGTSAEYVFTQEFMQLRTSVSAAAIGSLHPTYGTTSPFSGYVLVSEGPKEDAGAGMVRWRRVYAAIPASHNEWESCACSFPATSPLGPLASTQLGRFRFSRLVTSRVQHDYFIVAAGTETAYLFNSPGNIPAICAFDYVTQYYDAEHGTWQYGNFYTKADYVSDDFVSTSAGGLIPTVPSETQYAAMLQDATVNKWKAGISFQKLTNANPPMVDVGVTMQVYSTAQTGLDAHNIPTVTSFYGQLAAEDSRLSRWMGNIFLRQTRFILAL